MEILGKHDKTEEESAVSMERPHGHTDQQWVEGIHEEWSEWYHAQDPRSTASARQPYPVKLEPEG